MKLVKIGFLIATICLVTLTTEAKSKIQIDSDENDCIDGWISMDVTVKIDDEKFKFNPSCSFSFSKKIETKNNVQCKIKAGMCSSFSPINKIEVTCSDHASESIQVLCPTKD